MRTFVTRFLSTGIFAAAVAGGPAAMGGYREVQKVTDSEIAQLPYFCWSQMEVPSATGPAYSIQDCGPWANHYCDGLVTLIRAKRQGNADAALTMVNKADTSIRYTDIHTKEYPKCSIRSHLEATKAEVQRLRSTYQAGRPAKSKR